jgi:type IV pilus assembly protein PilW
MFPIKAEGIVRERRHFRSTSISRGVTLIEVLVGIVIGLIGMLVIFQTISVWDARSRVSTSSGDAQIAGSLAMFNLGRDLRLAGMGFGTAGTAELGCAVNAFDNAAASSVAFTLRPVNIVAADEATAVPDTIEVLYGDSPFFARLQQFSGGTAAQLIASPSKYGFKAGDVVVETDGASNCNLAQISGSLGDDYLLTLGAGGTYTDFYSGNVTPVRWDLAAASMPALGAGNLYNLGPSPRDDLWSVDPTTGTLAYVNSMGTGGATQSFGVAEGVINLRAYYGCDANGDGQISDAEWQRTPPIDWTRVRAVRVALLVRGQDYGAPSSTASESPVFISPNPTYAGGTKLFVMTNVDGTVDSDVRPSPNNWRYYRYRVYEEVIPLRNMMWGQSALGTPGQC